MQANRRRKVMIKRAQRIIDLAGLGGIRERYTQGETLWMAVLSGATGFLLGILVVIALVGGR
jgi:uncharacterized protein involved in exopolysaccharide biosynthesis